MIICSSGSRRHNSLFHFIPLIQLRTIIAGILDRKTSASNTLKIITSFLSTFISMEGIAHVYLKQLLLFI